MINLDTVEARFNEALCNEVLGKTNDIRRPINSKIYGKDPFTADN